MSIVSEALNMAYHAVKESEKPQLFTDVRGWLDRMAPTTTIITDVLLLCTECSEPIKARINTNQWVRVEWIGPSGECLKCYQAKRPLKEVANAQAELEGR